jgi:hypothetical protein
LSDINSGYHTDVFSSLPINPRPVLFCRCIALELLKSFTQGECREGQPRSYGSANEELFPPS